MGFLWLHSLIKDIKSDQGLMEKWEVFVLKGAIFPPFFLASSVSFMTRLHGFRFRANSFGKPFADLPICRFASKREG